MIEQINNLGLGSAAESLLPRTSGAAPAKNFLEVINDMLGKVNAQQTSADQAVKQLALGQTDNVHGVMLEIAKADLGFRMFLEFRNRLTDALQEILHMQI